MSVPAAAAAASLQPIPTVEVRKWMCRVGSSVVTLAVRQAGSGEWADFTGRAGVDAGGNCTVTPDGG